MTTNDIWTKIFIPLTAAFIGALLAFWSQRLLKKREDKKAIFGTLMAYRNWGPYDQDFVKALNLVVVVFSGHAKVKEAFHKYLTCFRSKDVYSDGQRVDAIFHLMSEMAKAIGYSNLKHNDIKDYFVQLFPEDLKPEDKKN